MCTRGTAQKTKTRFPLLGKNREKMVAYLPSLSQQKSMERAQDDEKALSSREFMAELFSTDAK